jgi:hypothetical protein
MIAAIQLVAGHPIAIRSVERHQPVFWLTSSATKIVPLWPVVSVPTVDACI